MLAPPSGESRRLHAVFRLFHRWRAPKCFPRKLFSLSPSFVVSLPLWDPSVSRAKAKQTKKSIDRAAFPSRSPLFLTAKRGRLPGYNLADRFGCSLFSVQINESVASTSGVNASKNVTGNQITVTLADKEPSPNAFTAKLSNGTIPKIIGKDTKDAGEGKDALNKPQSGPEETNRLTPVQGGRIGERRASSPFQNGQTEVLIGEPEGGPRSPRGSTSSAINDGNFLNQPDERDDQQPICRSRIRSGNGVTDIHSQQHQQQQHHHHQQQHQLQENNNAKKPQEGLGPDEMWAPGGLGPHRELPVDVPDTLLQKAYPNKVKNCSSDYRNELGPRSDLASDLDLSLNLKNETLKSSQSPPPPPPRITNADDRARTVDQTDATDATSRPPYVRNGHHRPSHMVKIELKIESVNLEDEDERSSETKDACKELEVDSHRRSPSTLGFPDLKNPFKDFDEEEDEGVNEDTSGQKESSVDVDVEEDYPFAKEDYPTMLKTCSDDSASPRSSSGRSDSTAPLDSSLVLRHAKNRGKDSPTYDARRIDLGSPCRPVVPEIKVAPLFARTRDTTSFDNPAYGLADLQDLQGLLMRSDEVSDLTRLIDEQCVIPRLPRDQVSPVRVKESHQRVELLPSEPPTPASKSAKSSKIRRPAEERTKLKAKTKSLDAEELMRAGSNEDLVGIESGSSLSSSSRQRPKKKRHQQISSGYSTLRSDASTDHELVERSFLVVGGKAYREVAVDCPPDFIPVTKCHPVYPPPNKTPGSSKQNTLEPKRERNGTVNRDGAAHGGLTAEGRGDDGIAIAASSPCLPSKDLSLATETVAARTLDRKHDSSKKVRSKVKSLLLDSFLSFVHHEPSPTRHRKTFHASSTQHPVSSNRSLLSLNSNCDPLPLPRPLIRDSLANDAFSSSSALWQSAPPQARFSRDLTADFAMSPNSIDFGQDDLFDGKPKVQTETTGCLSYVQETNQNSRNSLRETNRKFGGYQKGGVSPGLEESPSVQNQKNVRLSLEYKRSKFLDVPWSLAMCRDGSKSDPELFFPSRCGVQSWLSDLNLAYPSTYSRESPVREIKFDCRDLCLNDSSWSTPKLEKPRLDASKIHTCSLYQGLDSLDQHQAGLNGVKPAIPPRDQKRAPARPPKDNLRLSTQNNNVESTDNANAEPTQQQLHSIRKYQEQLRKRKDEEERQEILNRSLRGSTKLQALESHATSLAGQENPAYSQDEVTTVGRSTHVLANATHEVEEPPRPLTYGEVVATLERLQLQLRSISGALGISGPGVEAELEAVRTLLVQSRFASALATHHVLKNRLRSGKVLKHHVEDASTLARDCVEILEKWQSSSTTTGVGGAETMAAVEELTGILTNYDMEALLLSHDSIVSYVDGLQRKQSPSSSSPSGPPSPTSSWRGSRAVDNIKIIRIEKTNEPLGATVRNEGDAVIIGRVVRGGAADKSGLLHEGDEVLEVNGVEMRGKSVNEVCDILAGMQGSLTFLVLPAPTSHRNNLSNRREDSNQLQHIRAHFDYDPEEDPYIPCRELGVGFQKGDVLHVISQEDPNWWQAYREGEDDQTLAGLIPSKAFQHQRESMKQTIAGDKSTVRGSKKSSTLLCARKTPKKKKRNKSGANYNDDGYPHYATTAIDDYDSEEVLTYEEVALYYPKADHKRPIVLIGPPNIGRHELRQRLMQDSERFAAAIPHTSRPRKDSEVDGQDYHFISRSQFESDILCRKFVEHGEYEKAYYGTSVEAIRTVVNSGKICVLNLHPQSLKILRNSDLKPYVVFVAPPSLEKLRQKRIKNNESFKEEELKDIIEKAREMEDKYGHLFDMIIINTDTDRAYSQLLTEINSLEREPQWVPASWIQ
ncbi:uncharacterized protein LOC128886794 [Hylaeus anthracinus]|uniref:uncharacterized protein LOC128886794 n=1 Tax=Hylaeus anthracinus TaxID=313031 RepID=UPI0023BA3972|nr:uncharacterized protein LOC128886794 [Hylaeus anthracinus]